MMYNADCSRVSADRKVSEVVEIEGHDLELRRHMGPENDSSCTRLEECLERLLKAYSHQYDIQRDVTVNGVLFPAMANYFLRDENYLITRKHVLNVVENFEYVYFYLTESLDAATLKQRIDLTLQDGLQRIKPDKNHMSSYVTLVVLAEHMDAEAAALLKKTRFRKNFRMALQGWMEYRTAAMECSTNTFLSNPAGRGTRKLLEANFPVGV